MCRSGILVSTIVATAMLAACGRNEPTVSVAADPFANCKSLAPLLAVLPADKEVNGAREVYRECDDDHSLVRAVYGSEAESAEYSFVVEVTDAHSPLVDGLLNQPDNADASGMDSFPLQLNELAKSRLSQVEECERRANGKARKYEKPTALGNIGGHRFCVVDGHGVDNSVTWDAVALNGDVRLRLSMHGTDTASLIDAQQALEHLTPLLGRFDFAALPQ